MLNLIETAQTAVDDVVDVVGRSAIEAILQLSARQVAGCRHKGKASGNIHWHGSQQGVITMSDRKLRINEPRLRKKGTGQNLEVENTCI